MRHVALLPAADPVGALSMLSFMLDTVRRRLLRLVWQVLCRVRLGALQNGSASTSAHVLG